MDIYTPGLVQPDPGLRLPICICGCGYANMCLGHQLTWPCVCVCVCVCVCMCACVVCVPCKGKLVSSEHSVNFNKVQDVSIHRSSNVMYTSRINALV